MAQVGLPEDTETLYRKARPPEPDEKTGELPEPCRACEGAGFRARAAVFEMIDATEGVKAVISAGGDSAAIRKQVKEEKQLNCQKDAPSSQEETRSPSTARVEEVFEPLINTNVVLE